jgi:Xaa-Pro dipeptidase
VIPNTAELRQLRVDHARARIGSLRELHDGRALVLSSVGAVAWATGGLSAPIDRAAALDPVWVVLRDAGTTLVVNSVEELRIRSENDLDGLGFDVAVAPWYAPRGHVDAVERIVGAPLATCLTDGADGVDVSFDLTSRRLALSDAEVAVLTALALAATGAVEGAVHTWRPRVSTDRDIAAEVVAELERVGADAVCLIVGGDDRVREFRHPLSVGVPVNHLLMVVVVARCQGLHVALTRTATTGVDPEVEGLMTLCDEVQRGVDEVTRPGATWGDVYGALGDAYERIGSPTAWREHYQGGPIGYAQREFELAPALTSSPWWDVKIERSTAVAFNPSLAGGAKIEDTYLVEQDGPRLVTDSGAWPRRGGVNSAAAVWVQ